VSTRDILRVLFKRKALILSFFVLTVGTAALASFLMKPTYVATAQVLVKLGRENVYVPTLGPGNQASPVYSTSQQEEQVNAEIDILRGQFLAEKVVAAVGPERLYPDAAGTASPGWQAWLRQQLGRPDLTPFQRAVIRFRESLGVEGAKKSNVITLTVKHQDPERASQALNTLIRHYLDHHLEVHKSPLSTDFFSDQARVLQDRLRQAEHDLDAFRAANNITALDEQRVLLLRREAERRTALQQTVSQESETQDRLRRLREQLDSAPATITLEEEVDFNPQAIGNLQARLVELELKEHELLAKYTERSRLVRGVREEIASVRTTLAGLESKRYGRTRSGQNPVRQALEQDYLRTQAEVDAVRARRQNLQAQVGGFQKDLDRLNATETQLSRLQQAVDVERQNHRLYLTKLEESRISNAMDAQKVANVSVIEEAKTPYRPASPQVKLNLLLALVLGGLGALGLAFVAERWDDRLDSPEQAEDALQLPVLASISEFRA
jgi:uncharacterized protein involved in exopolysaccharide biosynthesis